MPPRARQKKVPAPVSSARCTEEPDGLDPKLAAAVPTAPAVGRRRRKIAAVEAAAPIKETTSKAEGTSHTDVAPPTSPKRAARKVQRSFYVDVDVLEDALVNPGLAAMVKHLQDTYNAGKPFRRVSHMQTGRPRQ